MQRLEAPVRRFYNWYTRAVNTIYLAASDGFAVVLYTNVSTDTDIRGFTDSANPPVTARQQVTTNSITNPKYVCFCMPVKKGDYWEVTNTAGSPTLYWINLIP